MAHLGVSQILGRGLTGYNGRHFRGESGQEASMGTSMQRERDEQTLMAGMRRMHQEVYEWREAHPEASFDEIAAQVTPRRRQLVSLWLEQLAKQHGSGAVAEGWVCERCGQPMTYKGEPRREVQHYLEGETALERAYYYCDHCQSGLFPPG
jgi:hypothetical protein